MVALASGCGRVAFDERLDARRCLEPIGHDEDSDGVDDACDVCPQLADDQRDADGDLVGDACDLASTIEERLLFDPFVAMRSEWTYDGMGTFNGDSITIPGIGRSGVMTLAGTPGRTVIELGGRVAAVESGGNLQVALHIGELVGGDNYYCELYASTDFNLKLTSVINTTYSNLALTPIPGLPAPGERFRLVFEHTPPSLRCVGWWDGVRYEVTATDPGEITPERIRVGINDAEIEAEYFSRLATP